MKYCTLFCSVAIFSTVYSAVHAQNDFLSVLRQNGLGGFADFVAAQAPLTLGRMTGRNDLTIFVPASSVPLPTTNSTIRRRDAEAEAEVAQHCTDDSPPPPPKLKRQAAPISDSNFEIRRTFLNDPSFINLGPGAMYSVVTNYAGPTASGDNAADIEISTGLGNIVNATRDPIKFEGGIIYVVDAWFTLPQTLITTLEVGGATTFVSAIRAANLDTKLDTTPRITVFAPLNSLSNNGTIEGQVVYDFVGYTPILVPGEKYGDITVTKEGAQWFANGQKIVKSDVPIKNGVVHYVDNSDSSEPPTPAPNVTTPGMPQFTGAAATVTAGSKISVIGLMAALAAGLIV